MHDSYTAGQLPVRAGCGGRIIRCAVINSCQSAATYMMVKRCCS